MRSRNHVSWRDVVRWGRRAAARADSFAEAEEIAKADPMHARGRRSSTLDRWQVNEVGFTLKVQFAKRTTTLD